MKTSIALGSLFLGTLISCLSLAPCFAADTDSPAVQTPVTSSDSGTALQAAVAPPKLPYGVDDVLKLSKAQISENIILTYVNNSGTVYNLTPNDIVYLRNQGVTDPVLNAMLDQRKRALEATAAQPTLVPNPQPPAPAYTTDPNAGPQGGPAPVYSAPAQAPSSSVYVMPYPPASDAYYGYPADYGYSPYYGYGPYYGVYGGPIFSFGFGGRGWGGHFGHGFSGGHFGGGHFSGGHSGGGHSGGHR
jgi:hypothetical protein